MRVQAFVDAPAERVAQVVQTNLLGCLLCTRAAMRAMAAQPGGSQSPLGFLRLPMEILKSHGRAAAVPLPYPQYLDGAPACQALTSSARLVAPNVSLECCCNLCSSASGSGPLVSVLVR